MTFKGKRFYLQRHKDVSGVSGEGKVAEGIEFENGICVLSFSSPFAHANVYTSLRVMEEVHGHGGASEVVFIDGEE